MVSAAAVYAAEQLGVRRIVAFSQSGFTARLVARYRPPSPIMAFTPDARVARQLQLVWGVRPFVAELQVGSLEDIVTVVERKLLATPSWSSPATASSSSWGTPCASGP